MVDLHDDQKANKERLKQVDGRLGQMEGKLGELDGQLQTMTGIMEQLLSKKGASVPTAVPAQPWGYDMEAPPLEQKDAMSRFLEYLDRPALPNIVEDEMEECRIRWMQNVGPRKDYIDATTTRDRAVAAFGKGLPEFNGLSRDVDQWCQRMLDHWSEKRGLSFSKEVQILQIWKSFGDVARKRIGSFAPEELAAKNFTTSEYLEAILETFVNKRTREEARIEYEQRMQLPGESVVAYYREKQLLMTRAIPSAERNWDSFKTLFSKGIRHLRLQSKFQDCMHQITEVGQMIPQLRTLLHAQRLYANNPNNPHGDLRGLELETSRTDDSQYLVKEEDIHTRDEGQGGINVISKTEVICHSCKKRGHFQKDCRSNPMKCYNCDRSGHMSRVCRLPKRNRSGNYKEKKNGDRNRRPDMVAAMNKVTTELSSLTSNMSSLTSNMSTMKNSMSALGERVTKAGFLETDVDMERSASPEKLSNLLSSTCVLENNIVSHPNALLKPNEKSVESKDLLSIHKKSVDLEDDICNHPLQKEIVNLSFEKSVPEIFNPEISTCLGPQYQADYLPNNDRETQKDVEDSLSRILSISRSQGAAAFVKYKLSNRRIFGLGLVDTGNLVQSTLISKEFFDLLGLRLIETKEYYVGTADKESKGLKILGQSESLTIFLDGIDQAIVLNPTVVEGLSHPLNLGLGFMKENELTLRCNPEGVTIMEG